MADIYSFTRQYPLLSRIKRLEIAVRKKGAAPATPVQSERTIQVQVSQTPTSNTPPPTPVLTTLPPATENPPVGTSVNVSTPTGIVSYKYDGNNWISFASVLNTLRPTTSSGGFLYPERAYDGNLDTPSTGTGAVDGTWSGFSALAGTFSSVTLNVHHYINGLGNTITYSLDGGATWTMLASGTESSPTTTQATLPTSQDFTQVRVLAHSITGSIGVHEIWIDVLK